MKRKSLFITLGGLFLGVLLGLGILWSTGAISGNGAGNSHIRPAIGQVAPDFQLAKLDGSTGRLSDYQGHPVLVNFWASWCDPCKAEMPLLEKYYQKYSPGLVVLGVNYEEGKVVAKQFIDKEGVSFPILLDTEGKTGELYEVRGFPTTFFIDANGVLRSEHIGQLDQGLLAQYLDTIGLKP